MNRENGIKVGAWCNKQNVTAVTRIRTWVTAATTQGTNHYTITASCKHKYQEVDYTEVVDQDPIWIRGFRF